MEKDEDYDSSLEQVDDEPRTTSVKKSTPEVPLGDKSAIDKIIDTTEATVESAEKFLVKYKYCSYLGAEWITREDLARIMGKMSNAYITRFKNRSGSDRYSIDEPFNPAFLVIDRIFNSGQMGPDIYFLVKWCGLTYDQATWESMEVVEKLDSSKIAEFNQRQYISKEKQSEEKDHDFVAVKESPVYANGNQLRSYQLEGLNWLADCYHTERNSILGDEMGLGKTIQSTAFLHYLYFTLNVTGPFLVVVPLSTIGNWERELRNWTTFNTVVYHGKEAARNLIVDGEFYYRDANDRRVPDLYKFDVILTTYDVVNDQNLRFISWRCVILDEAHKLKNKTSKITQALKTFSFDHIVLLSGTVIQNSIAELWALLNFLDPKKFDNEAGFQKEFGNLSQHEDVVKLQNILRPLMLRRLKEDVEKDIPILEETIIEVELTTLQKKYYKSILERNFSWLKQGTKTKNMPNLMNIMMELRKTCIHPFLLKGAEEQIFGELRADTPMKEIDAIIQASGKMVLIDKLLAKLHADGHKVLIFSQMTRCLNILEDYITSKNYNYERIDGSVRGDMRQAAIDRFSQPGSDKFVFLLCTRAGGVGINLTVADTVIIFDSDWNPQNDIQAQSRCHRIGQTKTVKVYRLITRNTYEQEMFQTASRKLGLDRAILQRQSGTSAPSNQELEGTGSGAPSTLSKSEVENLLKKGAYCVLDDEESRAFCEEDIQSILEKRTQIIRHDNGGAERSSIFSKASFSSSNSCNVSLDDANFWEKMKQHGDMDVVDNGDANPLIQNEPRSRRPARRSDIIPKGSAGKKPITSDNGKDDEFVVSKEVPEISDYSSPDEMEGDGFNEGKRLFSKKQRVDFRKTLMSFGVEHKEDGTRDWSRFKVLCGFDKSDELLNLQYKKTMSMAKECIRVAEEGIKISSTHTSDDDLPGRGSIDSTPHPVDLPSDFNPKIVRIERGLDSISYDASKRVIKRVQMMRKLREQILTNPNIDEHLAMMAGKKWSGLPNWWTPALDKPYLQGVAKSGFVRSDMLLDDSETAFGKIYQDYASSLPPNVPIRSTKDFWMTENVCQRRFDHLTEVIMDPSILGRKKTRIRRRKIRPEDGAVFGVDKDEGSSLLPHDSSESEDDDSVKRVKLSEEKEVMQASLALVELDAQDASAAQARMEGAFTTTLDPVAGQAYTNVAEITTII